MSKRTIKQKRKSPKKKTAATTKNSGGHIDIPLDELKNIVKKIKSGELVNTDEADKLGAAVDTLAFVTNELELKGASVRRLRKLIFGSSSEKYKDVFPSEDEKQDKSSKNKDINNDDKNGDDTDKADSSDEGNDTENEKSKGKKAKRKGHGRNSAKDYTGAEKKKIEHESLKAKDNCPECLTGKLYTQKEPAVMVRVIGMAPLAATVYEMERLRCNLCGKVFTAKTPAGLGEERYDHSAAAMIALLKYGCGMPFNRLERLEKDLGIPLPSSTQWEVAYRLALGLAPIYTEFISQAANGKVLHNDDTVARILNLESSPIIGKNGKERTGIFTSAILSIKDNLEIALFFTSRKHAGENLGHVLSLRNKELSVPIHMCDGISANTAFDFETLLANCNSHSRRKFVEVADDYIKETKYILDVFKLIYKNDDETKKQKMTDDQRLEYHIKHSKPVLDDLEQWFVTQIEIERNIEPNSSLGEAIKYMTGHWNELTLFLKVPGAPIDNNCCERVIKKAILHRKNALFFKSENGAYVADLFMSLIHTCELQNVNPFDYLVTLAKNPDKISENPSKWMPWNYQNELKASEKN